MKKKFIPFTKPSIGQNEIAEVTACLESGWLTTGPRVEQFEQRLGDYMSAPHTLALASATAGLHLALLALRLQPGDEVITTPLSFVATANTIVIAGGKPVFVDIDPSTYNINVEKIEAAITPKTRAIIPVHFAGLPVDLDPIYQLARKHQFRVIEDAAHAIGASYYGKKLGAFGDTQVFSFHPNKNMTTGEGGCITTHDRDIANFIKYTRFHGIYKEPIENKDSHQLHYDIQLPGFKYNMMDMQAAIGIHQLDQLETFNRVRRDLAQSYQTILENIPQLTLPKAPSYPHQHVWHLYTPLLNLDKIPFTRDQFIQEMHKHNIAIGLHYHPIHLFTFYRERFGYKRGDFPHAEDVGKRIISLPLFPSMTTAEQDHVIESMLSIFRSH